MGECSMDRDGRRTRRIRTASPALFFLLPSIPAFPDSYLVAEARDALRRPVCYAGSRDKGRAIIKGLLAGDTGNCTG